MISVSAASPCYTPSAKPIACGKTLTALETDTHGPRISQIDFSSNPSVAPASIETGALNSAEWTFEQGDIASFTTYLTSCSPTSSPCGNVVTNATLGYTWDGIAFNVVINPIIGNVWFRRAITELTDWTTVQSTILYAGLGIATPNFTPCVLYTAECSLTLPVYNNNTEQAAQDLMNTGLLWAFSGTSPVTSASDYKTITIWCTTDSACTPTSSTFFNPNIYARSDDPVRDDIAVLLSEDAANIGLTLTVVGINDAQAGTEIYGTGAANGLPGCMVYNPTTGYNNATGTSCVDHAPYNTTSIASGAGGWDMYTYGWVTSIDYEALGIFFNSAFIGTTLNFGTYYNQTIDKLSNDIVYATSNSAANTALGNLDVQLMKSLPYENWLFESELTADYVAGWTGYSIIPTYGPNWLSGLTYTLLNVHPSTSLLGGTYSYAIHAIPDDAGLNPLYNTEWVWQADVWDNIYDSPLATAPTAFTSLNTFMNWMTTSFSVSSYTGKTGTGGAWYDYETANAPHATKAYNIVGGQTLTLNFMQNITFQDGVPFTAKDYAYSLFAWDLAASPDLPSTDTPTIAELSGPAGLIAANVVNPYEIVIYVNSTSVWNLPDLILPVFPQHLLGTYFNQGAIATLPSTLDTSLPYPGSCTATACTPTTSVFTTSTHTKGDVWIVPKAPKWVYYEPNMEVSTGPFQLSSYDGVLGSGTMLANPTYFRTAWYADINATTNTVTAPTPWTDTITVQLLINNPQSVTYCGVSAGTVGECGIVGPSVSGESSLLTKNTITVYKNGLPTQGVLCKTVKKVVTCSLTSKKPSKFSLTQIGTTDQYTLSIPTNGLPAGNYEVVIHATYTFQGLPRTWNEYVGFAVS